MSDNATAKKPAAWRVDVEGIGSIMPICRDWVEVQGICNRFGDRVFGVAPLYEETTTLPAAWILVSERLPENKRVLIASRSPNTDKINIDIGDVDADGVWRDDQALTLNDVIAWMPLPDPPTN
jgi:hypothetical protein